MEYKALSVNVKNLAPNGVTLNIEEKMQVQLALTQLQGEMNFEELYFWGKVEGKYPLIHKVRKVDPCVNFVLTTSLVNRA